MKPINTRGQGRPVAIRMEFVGFDKPSARGSSGTARAARSLLRRRFAGAKRIEAVLKPEAAAALARSAGALRAHLLGDHRGAAGRACQGREEG